ncbi:c-type cytochrome [Rhodopseudomonas telluris]|uniref:C-type cytochrome n=1 Tax=Rhodopseudomonas telluris TaxID=644215 RepID=A0ABV6EMY8_9BRAD
MSATLLMISSADAATRTEYRGYVFAKSHCARCHAIGRTGQSRLKQAPPFRTLHNRYPIETLAEAFAEGIYTGHSKMPAFELDPDEINDLLSYLKSLN